MGKLEPPGPPAFPVAFVVVKALYLLSLAAPLGADGTSYSAGESTEGPTESFRRDQD